MQFSSNYIAYNIALHANSFDSIIFIFSDVSSNLSQSYSIFHNLLSVSISQHYLLCYRAINDHLSSTTPFDNFIVCLFLKFSLHQLVSFFLFFFNISGDTFTHSLLLSVYFFLFVLNLCFIYYCHIFCKPITNSCFHFNTHILYCYCIHYSYIYPHFMILHPITSLLLLKLDTILVC